MPDEKTKNLARRQGLLVGVAQFAEKLHSCASVVEIGLAGSLASDDEYPNDIDAVLFLDHVDELSVIARFARQMSSITASWEVFVFTRDFSYLGRICHYKVCRPRAACADKRCGIYPHMYDLSNFVFDPGVFFSSPFRLFWTRQEHSLWGQYRKQENITLVRTYATHQPMRRICGDCGRPFVFSVAEQKHFSKVGYTPPKRCDHCRIHRWS